jgi:hypothetical protein
VGRSLGMTTAYGSVKRGAFPKRIVVVSHEIYHFDGGTTTLVPRHHMNARASRRDEPISISPRRVSKSTSPFDNSLHLINRIDCEHKIILNY